MEGTTDAVFGGKICRVVAVKRLVGIVQWAWSFPRVLGDEVLRVADVPLGPFELMELGKILDKILVSFEGMGDLTEIDYSGPGELIPKRPDNGMG